MHIAFIDDSKQTGKRLGMGDLLALGAAIFPETSVGPFTTRVGDLFDELSIPRDTEMKWNVPDGSFLKTAPPGTRHSLYERVLRLADDLRVRTVVVIWDSGRTYLQGDSAKRLVLQYLYERISVALDKAKDIGILVADKPGGGVKNEAKWLARTLTLTDFGTEFVEPGRVVMPVVTAPSHHLRHLQLADLVVSSTTAVVAGRNPYADELLPHLMRLAHRNAFGYVGGTGIKLFPDDLVNLYHWVFSEDAYSKVGMGTAWPLPQEGYEYGSDNGL